MKYLILCLLLSGCCSKTTIAPEWIQTYPSQIRVKQQVEQRELIAEYVALKQENTQLSQAHSDDQALIAKYRELIVEYQALVAEMGR